MRKFKLTQKHIATLLFIKAGNIQEQIAIELKEASSTTSFRIKMLVKEGYVFNQFRDHTKFLKLTEKGDNCLIENSNLQSPTAISFVAQSSNLPPKRLNGMRIYLKPNPTEYSKLEAMFKEAKLIPRISKVRNARQYEIDYDGYAFKFTTRKLIIYCPYAFKGFNIEGRVFRSEEYEKGLAMAHHLIERLKIKILMKEGYYWSKLAYWELAHTQSSIARAVTRRKSYVPLAYNPQTGRCVDWADRSLKLHELEFNQDSIEAKNAVMQQDMYNGTWNHREEQQKSNKLEDLISKVANLQETITNRQVEQDVRMEHFTTQIELHLKVMRKIDQKLSQKKLSDF